MGPRKLKNEKQKLQKENGTDVREATIKKNTFFRAEKRSVLPVERTQ